MSQRSKLRAQAQSSLRAARIALTPSRRTLLIGLATVISSSSLFAKRIHHLLYKFGKIHIVDVVKIGSITLKSLDSLQQFWIKEITPYETSSVCRRNSVLVTLL